MNLVRIAETLRLITGALLVAVALRFILAAGAVAFPSVFPAISEAPAASGRFEKNPSNPPKQGMLNQVLQEVKRSHTLSNDAGLGSSRASDSGAGTWRHLDLVITAHPDRSEVFVDGISVGQSPFVGTTTCREGQEVRIELVPPRGLPRGFTRPCRGGTVRVEE